MIEYKKYGTIPLRLALAAVFIYHGYLKLFVQFPDQFFASLGIPLAYTFAIVVTIVEFFGGVALLIGLFTRYVSVLLAIVMTVAIITVHLPNGFPSMEFPLMNLGALIALILFGAGEISLDKYINYWGK